MTVWKFVLAVMDIQDVPMPLNARVLHVGMQGGQITLWAWVDPGAEFEPRRIAIVGTGGPAPAPNGGVYLGTTLDGPFVWHVFERTS